LRIQSWGHRRGTPWYYRTIDTTSVLFPSRATALAKTSRDRSFDVASTYETSSRLGAPLPPRQFTRDDSSNSTVRSRRYGARDRVAHDGADGAARQLGRYLGREYARVAAATAGRFVGSYADTRESHAQGDRSRQRRRNARTAPIVESIRRPPAGDSQRPRRAPHDRRVDRFGDRSPGHVQRTDGDRDSGRRQFDQRPRPARDSQPRRSRGFSVPRRLGAIEHQPRVGSTDQLRVVVRRFHGSGK